MKNYYIYHIPGIKIGCTQDVPHRMREQQFTEWEHLETHTDIYEASTRELELQAEFGLPIDKIPYWQAVENRRLGGIKGGSSKGNRTAGMNKACVVAGGKAVVKSGQLKSISSSGGKVAGNIIRECVHCNRSMKGPAYFVHHGDNCKQKNETKKNLHI